MISRREPLLWLQLMALAVIPLELELLRLVLAGPGFGPAPALERLLIWGLGVVAPGVLLWRRSPDWASLILVRIAASKRSVDQRRISAIQQPLGLKAALIIGMALLLPLFWWIDRSALLVVEFSPTSQSSRLTALLIAAPLLALMLWQWQQFVQAIWLLTRSDQAFTDLTPINAADLQTNHVSLGLGLLQLPPLQWEATVEPGLSTQTSPGGKSDHDLKQTAPDPEPESQQSPEVIAADEQKAKSNVASAGIDTNKAEQEQHKELCDVAQDVQDGDDSVVAESELDPQPEAAEARGEEDSTEDNSGNTEISSAESEVEAPSAVAPVAIKPEQAAEEDDCPDLDGQVSADGTVASTDAETHHEEAKASGSEQSDPEQPAQSSPGSP